MRTDIRIEHLVLDGLELSRRERDALSPAIARELRLLANPPAKRTPNWRTEDRRRKDSPVEQIARQVAVAVHQATATARPAAHWGARGRR